MIRESLGFGSGKHECNAVAVISEATKPVSSFRAIGRIHPYKPSPFPAEPIISSGVVLCRCIPWAVNRSAGIKIEGAESFNDFRGSEPSVSPIRSRLMRTHCAAHAVPPPNAWVRAATVLHGHLSPQMQ
jgi:hypothetical protein